MQLFDDGSTALVDADHHTVDDVQDTVVSAEVSRRHRWSIGRHHASILLERHVSTIIE